MAARTFLVVLLVSMAGAVLTSRAANPGPGERPVLTALASVAVAR